MQSCSWREASGPGAEAQGAVHVIELGRSARRVYWISRGGACRHACEGQHAADRWAGDSAVSRAGGYIGAQTGTRPPRPRTGLPSAPGCEALRRRGAAHRIHRLGDRARVVAAIPAAARRRAHVHQHGAYTHSSHRASASGRSLCVHARAFASRDRQHPPRSAPAPRRASRARLGELSYSALPGSCIPPVTRPVPIGEFR